MEEGCKVCGGKREIRYLPNFSPQWEIVPCPYCQGNKVISLPKPVAVPVDEDPKNIKAMAKTFAQNIQDNKYQALRSVTITLEREDGSIEVFGWGDVGLVRSIGILHLGIERLTEMRQVNQTHRG